MAINDNTVCTIDYNRQKWLHSVHSLWTGTIVNDDRSVYSDDMYECIGDLHVSVMMPQGDTNICAQINTPPYTVRCA